MSVKYNTLEELRRKKQIIKSEIQDMEDLITFQNPQESLSVISGGLTDHFLKTKTLPDGNTKLSLNTGNLIKEASEKLKEGISQKSVVHFASSNEGIATFDNILQAGLIAGVNRIATKNMKSFSWKKKALGLAITVLAPIAFNFIKKQLSEYQKHKTTSSLEKLI